MSICEHMIDGSKEASCRSLSICVSTAVCTAVRWLTSLRDAVVAHQKAQATLALWDDVTRAPYDDCRHLDKARTDIVTSDTPAYANSADKIADAMGAMLARVGRDGETAHGTLLRLLTTPTFDLEQQ